MQTTDTPFLRSQAKNTSALSLEIRFRYNSSLNWEKWDKNYALLSATKTDWLIDFIGMSTCLGLFYS